MKRLAALTYAVWPYTVDIYPYLCFSGLGLKEHRLPVSTPVNSNGVYADYVPTKIIMLVTQQPIKMPDLAF